jgi:hypothetical protein
MSQINVNTITPTSGTTITVDGDLNVTGTNNIIPYKVYRALITQVDTAEPTAIVLENTLGEVTWSRVGLGIYLAASPGLFTEDKTFLLMGRLNTLNRVDYTFYRANNNYAYIQTRANDIDSDSLLTKTAVEICVYDSVPEPTTTTTTESPTTTTTTTESPTTTTTTTESPTTTTTTTESPTTTTTTTCGPESTHPYVAYFINSTTSFGNFTSDFSAACSSKDCLNNSTCTDNGSIPAAITNEDPQVGDGLYGDQTGCATYEISGYFILPYQGTYNLFEVTNGIITAKNPS